MSRLSLSDSVSPVRSLTLLSLALASVCVVCVSLCALWGPTASPRPITHAVRAAPSPACPPRTYTETESAQPQGCTSRTSVDCTSHCGTPLWTIGVWMLCPHAYAYASRDGVARDPRSDLARPEIRSRSTRDPISLDPADYRARDCSSHSHSQSAGLLERLAHVGQQLGHLGLRVLDHLLGRCTPRAGVSGRRA